MTLEELTTASAELHTFNEEEARGIAHEDWYVKSMMRRRDALRTVLQDAELMRRCRQAATS